MQQVPDLASEQELIILNIKQHFPAWAAAVQSAQQVQIRKLSGMSNACYKVELAKDIPLTDKAVPRTLLYRKFECKIVDRQVEATIFQRMSDAGLGPQMYFQNEHYRIEGFFEGRPLTIWELRNPFFTQKFVETLFQLHEKSGNAAAINAI